MCLACLEACEHLVAPVSAIVNDDVVAAEGPRILHNIEQQGLISLIAYTEYMVNNVKISLSLRNLQLHILHHETQYPIFTSAIPSLLASHRQFAESVPMNRLPLDCASMSA